MATMAYMHFHGLPPLPPRNLNDSPKPTTGKPTPKRPGDPLAWGRCAWLAGQAPPLTGPSGAPSDAGRFDRENVLVGRRLKKLTDWLTRVIRIDAGPLHALECMGRGVKKSAIRHLETDRLDIFSRAQVLGGRGTPSCMMVQPGWWPAPALAPDCGPT